jgi:hypothetical protein
MNRSYVISIILIAILVVTLIAVKFFNLQMLTVFAYSLFFIGIYIFFLSYLKQNKTGIITGSSVFLTGSILFVITKYEMLNLGSIFIPVILVIVGLSFFIGSVLIKPDALSIIFSVLCLFAGLWLIINRGDANLNLFLSAVYSIIKNYWLVLLGSAVIIIFVSRFFKKTD